MAASRGSMRELKNWRAEIILNRKEKAELTRLKWFRDKRISRLHKAASNTDNEARFDALQKRVDYLYGLALEEVEPEGYGEGQK